MNNFNFTGNLGRDCETRFIPSGDSITNFTVAVTSGYGEKAVTTWVNCSLWGKRGEAVAPYLKKGQSIAISGELTNRQYTDKDGNQKYSLEVRVNDLTLTGGKQDSAAQGAKHSTAHEPDQSFDQEIPF